jgi:glycosyltransferase involved in cell wall biosynthesis
MDPYDNVQDIVRAAAIVSKIRPDVMFLVVGTGLSLQEVQALVAENRLEDKFTFTGWVPYEDMPKYLEKAHIGVIGGTDILANHMYMTLKLPEYWASGTAVVAPRMMAIQEVAEDMEDVLLYKPGDPKDLAAKILLLIQNEPLRTRLKEKGRLKLEKEFDWEMLSEKIWSASRQGIEIERPERA